MRKILLMLLFLSCSTSFASEIDFAPKWSNIAPAEYSKDIQELKPYYVIIHLRIPKSIWN